MYPTAKERLILHYLNKYHYLTTEALMIATGTKLRAVQSHLTHLVATEKKPGYIWRIPRGVSDENTKLMYAYVLSGTGKTYLEQFGEKVVLPSRNPNPVLFQHTLTINDVLIRADVLAREHPEDFLLVRHVLESELRRQLHKSPVIPDAFIEIGILSKKLSYELYFEIDMGAEWGTQGAKWYEKIVAYIPFLDERTNATVVVITPVSAQRVKKLKEWTETVLKKYQREDLGSAFYFASLQRGMSPEQLFLEPVYHIAFQEGTHYLFDL